VSVWVTVDLDRDAELTPRAGWYETNQHPGCGHLWLGPDVSLLANSPAAWRALAAAATRIADQLDGLYAEHGVESPAALTPSPERSREETYS
jgi:hypothetical protein